MTKEQELQFPIKIQGIVYLNNDHLTRLSLTWWGCMGPKFFLFCFVLKELLWLAHRNFVSHFFEHSTLPPKIAHSTKVLPKCCATRNKLGNILRTWLESIGNTVRTHWLQPKKNPLPHPPNPNPKDKNWALLWVHVESSLWLHETYGPKPVCHHFWPQVMLELRVWVPIALFIAKDCA